MPRPFKPRPRRRRRRRVDVRAQAMPLGLLCHLPYSNS